MFGFTFNACRTVTIFIHIFKKIKHTNNIANRFESSYRQPEVIRHIFEYVSEIVRIIETQIEKFNQTYIYIY